MCDDVQSSVSWLTRASPFHRAGGRHSRRAPQRPLKRGLTQPLEEVSAVLVEHFPATGRTDNANELPDAPALPGFFAQRPCGLQG